jgi:hypothetical protein
VVVLYVVVVIVETDSDTVTIFLHRFVLGLLKYPALHGFGSDFASTFIGLFIIVAGGTIAIIIANIIVMIFLIYLLCYFLSSRILTKDFSDTSISILFSAFYREKNVFFTTILAYKNKLKYDKM